MQSGRNVLGVNSKQAEIRAISCVVRDLVRIARHGRIGVVIVVVIVVIADVLHILHSANLMLHRPVAEEVGEVAGVNVA